MIHYKLYLTMALISTCLFANAIENNDTVKAIDTVEKVVVTRDSISTNVDVTYLSKKGIPMKWNYEISLAQTDSIDGEIEIDEVEWLKNFNIKSTNYSNKVVRRQSFGFGNFYFGRSMYYDQPNVKAGFEIGLRSIAGIKWTKKNSDFEIGVGFGTKQMRSEDGYMFTKNGDKLDLIQIKDRDVKFKYSHLFVWSTQFPILYSFHPSKNTMFSIGGVVNLNCYSKVFNKYKTKYYTQDENPLNSQTVKVNETYKGLTPNFLTADLVASFYYQGIGFYVGWSPFEMFKKQYGPTAKGFSIGFTIK